MTNSAYRRNVAETLGIAAAADIKARRYLATVQDAARVSAFTDTTDLTWIECETATEAKPKRKRPRPHQRRAIRDCEKGLRKADRGQLIMACGTGAAPPQTCRRAGDRD